MEIAMLRLGWTMSLAGILLGAAATQAWADDSVIATYEKSKMLGTFAQNCNQPASSGNPYFHVRPATGTGRVVRDQMTGRDRKPITAVIDKAEATKQLKKVYHLAAAVRVQVGGLRPDRERPLSRFSGPPPKMEDPLDDDGYVRERLPANNVAALGRTLFSDYLLPLELAGVLLLVATIGAIVIAGRRTEGLR